MRRWPTWPSVFDEFVRWYNTTRLALPPEERFIYEAKRAAAEPAGPTPLPGLDDTDLGLEGLQ